MRRKDEIINESMGILNRLPVTSEAMGKHDHIFVEVFIDIRDILNERLLEIDKGLHDLSINMTAVIKDAATAIILAKTKGIEND